MPGNDEVAVAAADLAANRPLDELIQRAATGSFKPKGTCVVMGEDGQLLWRKAGTPTAGPDGGNRWAVQSRCRAAAAGTGF